MSKENEKQEETGSLTKREQIILSVINACIAGRRSGIGNGYIKDGFKYGQIAADLILGVKKPEDIKDT